MKTKFKLLISTFTFLELISVAYASQTLQNIYQNEAIKCETLTCIRENIDKINREMILLLARRTAFVQRAGDLKMKTRIANDPKRVQDQINSLSELSDELGLPKQISIETFKVLMKNSIEFEQKYIDRKLRE